MLMPSIFGEDLLDDFFDSTAMPGFGLRRSANYAPNTAGEHMKTDVKELKDAYEVSLTLPGVKKEDIQIELKDGNLNVSAHTSHTKDQKDEDGKYIRRERYCGSVSRSFYVGDHLQQEDIKARYEDGILTIDIPKIDPETRKEEERKLIAIEG